MSTQSSDPQTKLSADAPDGNTQQIPLVEDVPRKARAEAPSETGVPQETVPMPVPTWPPPPPISEAPQKPPSLRRRSKETTTATDLAGTQPWLVQRTGVLTSELRRALPPWALPLLSSQPVSVW